MCAGYPVSSQSVEIVLDRDRETKIEKNVEFFSASGILQELEICDEYYSIDICTSKTKTIFF